jgi:hypothetical protein
VCWCSANQLQAGINIPWHIHPRGTEDTTNLLTELHTVRKSYREMSSGLDIDPEPVRCFLHETERS